MSFELPTFQQLTAPGYFDFSGQQTAKTAAMVAWFDGTFASEQDQVNLFDESFRLWATRDYSEVTVSRTPWLQYLLEQYSIGWFTGNISVTVAILIYISKSYPANNVLAFQQLFAFLLAAPLEWLNAVGQIFFGANTPARFAETLLIYSDAGSPPSTPSPTPYTALEWEAPSGWTIGAENATYYSRGYLDSGNIVWMTPRSTSSVAIMQDVEDLAALAALPSPAEGDLCGVADDGTGDVGAVYYYDGADWRKTTTPNANQGEVVNGVPPDPGSSVWMPPGVYVTSGSTPPVSGPSKGYGYYGTYGNFVVLAKRIDILLDLTAAGLANLGMIIFLLRKIKPTLNTLFVSYISPDNPDAPITIEVFDSGAI